MTERKIVVKNLRVARGPFEFFYVATYKIADDGSWKLVSFKTNGYNAIANYPLEKKIELVKRFGSQAYKVGIEVAKKIEVTENEKKKKVELPSKARLL